MADDSADANWQRDEGNAKPKKKTKKKKKKKDKGDVATETEGGAVEEKKEKKKKKKSKEKKSKEKSDEAPVSPTKSTKSKKKEKKKKEKSKKEKKKKSEEAEPKQIEPPKPVVLDPIEYVEEDEVSESSQDRKMKELLQQWDNGSSDDSDESDSSDDEAGEDENSALNVKRMTKAELGLEDNALDHIVLAAPDFHEALKEFESMTGIKPSVGGSLKGLGTRTARVGLDNQAYIEILAPDPKHSGPIGAQLMDLEEGSLVPFHYAIRQTDLSEMANDYVPNELGYDPDRIAMHRAGLDGTPRKWEMLFMHGHFGGGTVPYFVDWGECEHPIGSIPQVGSLKNFVVSCPGGSKLYSLLGTIKDVTVRDGDYGLEFSFGSPEGTITFSSDKPQGLKFPGYKKKDEAEEEEEEEEEEEDEDEEDEDEESHEDDDSNEDEEEPIVVAAAPPADDEDDANNDDDNIEDADDVVAGAPSSIEEDDDVEEDEDDIVEENGNEENPSDFDDDDDDDGDDDDETET